MRLRLLYNPGAGKGRARRHIDEAVALLEKRGAAVELLPSRSREHLVELGRSAAADGVDRVVACGGDGTIHLAIRELDLGRATFGILPLGSGDDFARTLGIPTSLPDACDVVLGDTTRQIDVALANGTRYVCVAGFGFDAEVNRYANESVSRLRGTPLYLYSIFRVLRKFQPRRVRVSNGAEAREAEIMFAVVANAPRYGAGIRIAPAAVPDDGQLDLCVVGACSKFELIRTLPLAYVGKHVKRPFVTTRQGTWFRFETIEPMDVFADGEPVTRTPLTVTLAPDKLRVCVPRPPGNRAADCAD
ncbi:MAG: diacylglycerol/lipid kinase family protein [Thermoanaerobaculia bacterium]